MYKILTQIHLNYKFKKTTLKNIHIHGLSDCLVKGLKSLIAWNAVRCLPLFLWTAWKSKL